MEFKAVTKAVRVPAADKLDEVNRMVTMTHHSPWACVAENVVTIRQRNQMFDPR